jgi:hypothetical protein
MRSLSIQVQPVRSPGIDMERISSALLQIASDPLVDNHSFDNGHDNGAYFNFTFSTDRPKELWNRIRANIYDNLEFGSHMQRASMAMCSSDTGWDDYALLYHFDRTLRLDGEAAL